VKNFRTHSISDFHFPLLLWDGFNRVTLLFNQSMKRSRHVLSLGFRLTPLGIPKVCYLKFVMLALLRSGPGPPLRGPRFDARSARSLGRLGCTDVHAPFDAFLLVDVFMCMLACVRHAL